MLKHLKPGAKAARFPVHFGTAKAALCSDRSTQFQKGPAPGIAGQAAAVRSRPEIEIKLHVSDPRALKQRLKDLGFKRATPRLLERNDLYDFPDRRLARTKRALRLRRVGNCSLLTFKGAAGTSAPYKIRTEFETAVADAGQLRKLLKQLDLVETFHYEKYRTKYIPPLRPGVGDHASLLYDETSVGNYVELEGPASWIDRVARQLGYNRGDYITASYISLYGEKSRTKRQQTTNAPTSRRNASSPSRARRRRPQS